MKKAIAVILVLLFALLSQGLAQEELEPITNHPPFSTLIGTWQGEAWASVGPGQSKEFVQTEVVEAKANGQVLTVEGTGREGDEVVFQAFGYFAHDSENPDAYEFTAFRTEGYRVTVAPEVSDDTIIWGFDVEQGTIRYTITLTDTTWHETGEFSPDGGTTWYPTFEMNLTRVSE